MKLACIILIILSSTFCHGQGVRFQLYRTKACSTAEKLDSAYSLYKIGAKLDTAYVPKSGIVHLPGPGRYGVFASGPIIDTVYDIRDTGLFIARFKEPDMGLYITGATDTPPLYSRCDSLLNGYQEYQYPNGDLKMQGTFRKGCPKDSIVTFYPGRKMRKRIIISPKIVLIEEFDEAGHKIKVEHNQNKSFMSYCEYRREEYFPDGEIKRKESSTKGIVRIEEFYSGGQLKLKQTKKDRLEYYKDGKLEVSYSWKNIKKEKDHWNTYKIYQTKYDREGMILQSTIFEDWGYIISQPKLDIEESDWIVKVEKYNKGKVIFSVKDMDTKDYIKKYPNE